MKDKEQIIINGVNVSGCEYVCNTAFGNIGCKLPFNKEIHCCKNPNCYFKQLSHKTQECEQIKEKYEALKLENQEGYEIVDELKHEREQLKSELHLYKTWYQAKHGDIRNLLGSYRRALDEIEKVCLEDTYTFADGTQIRYDSLDDILNIINKAKDSK